MKCLIQEHQFSLGDELRTVHLIELNGCPRSDVQQLRRQDRV